MKNRVNHHYDDSDDYDGEDEEGEYDDDDDEDDSNLQAYRNHHNSKFKINYARFPLEVFSPHNSPCFNFI